MRRLSIIIVTLLFIIDTAIGLKCWTCDNAANDAQCRNKGFLRQCLPNENTCFSETRRIRPGMKLITRRCKEDLACNNTEIQNNRPAWSPTQCNKKQGSVCRCCCMYDGCNVDEKTACEGRYPACKKPEVPANGKMQCQYQRSVEGSYCEFTCDRKYALKGKKRIFCVDVNGKVEWSDKIPTCEHIECDQPVVLRRVERNCTDGNRADSLCHFTCKRDEYTVEPNSIMENHCNVNGTWSSPPPCCRLPCPPYTIMDLMIVLDSSSSVEIDNWVKMVSFVAGILSKLDLNENRTQVFVIRYNSEVDLENQLFMNNNETMDEINEQLQSIPYDGRGTETGKALQYVYDDLRHHEKNRKDVTDVVLLLTDGRGSDDVATPSKTLRDAGVEMFAIGVGNAVEEQLMEVTGTSDKLWPELKDFDSLTVDAATKIGDEICERSCA